MKPTHIVLTDQGIGCIEAPNMLNSVINHNWEIRYQQAIEAAMKQVVLFKDQNVWCWAIPDEMPVKGKLYPILDGYEVRFETWQQGDNKVDYAVLIPKQGSDKTISQTYSEEVFKQQPTSIEEAAEVYSKKSSNSVFQENHKLDFIAGARHQEEKLLQDLLDDIEMNLDDWCRTPLVMATKFRDKQFKQEKK